SGCEQQKIFEKMQSAISSQRSARFDPEKTRKKGIDSLSTVLSNVTLLFVCNKTLMGVGVWLRDVGRGLQERDCQNRRDCQNWQFEKGVSPGLNCVSLLES
ncbi:MAG: hypothetical protein ACXVKH_09605, partial [Candidatus Angelobacter sp.]